MQGVVFITRSGYDPEKGKHIKDPYLGSIPSFGACRPDIRRRVVPGDHVFLISGKVQESVQQFVIGGFSVSEKLDVLKAYSRFPEQRLHTRSDGQLTGNVVIDPSGEQHALDTHKAETFSKRIENYIVGKDPIALVTPREIERGRQETLGVLQRVLGKSGDSPIKVVGRWGSWLTEEQVGFVRAWLQSIKLDR
jgi:hypothetical protein